MCLGKMQKYYDNNEQYKLNHYQLKKRKVD